MTISDSNKKFLEDLLEYYISESESYVQMADEFGDDWNEKLNNNELNLIKEYFQKLELLKRKIDFVNLRVGDTENYISFNRKNNKGITFELPKNLLMNAVNYEVFDDLLIGNIMKTTFIISKKKYTLKYERKMPEKEALKMKSFFTIKGDKLTKIQNFKIKKITEKDKERIFDVSL